MPDEWEYPWFAAWDLAFQAVPFALVDPAFAKEQLLLLCREWMMHPNGQLPAYEWDFGDANPPVHAWAALQVYRAEAVPDRTFLSEVFHKLLLNFSWWVNRKDADGSDLFEGGFLGMDNIGPVNRSTPLLGDWRLEQSDATSWMAAFSLHLLQIALELARDDESYEDVATKFVEHFLYIARPSTSSGPARAGCGTTRTASATTSCPGNCPTAPSSPACPRAVHGRPDAGAGPGGAGAVGVRRAARFHQPAGLPAAQAARVRPVHHLAQVGDERRRNLALLDAKSWAGCWAACSTRASSCPRTASARCRRPTGTGWTCSSPARPTCIGYEPGESTTPMFGGNSNWRGPIWFPTNALLVEALHQVDDFHDGQFHVDLPTGSGQAVTARSGRRRAGPPAGERSSCPPRRQQAVRRQAGRGDGSALVATPHHLQRVLRRRHRRGPRGHSPDRLDGPGGPAAGYTESQSSATGVSSRAVR